MTTFVIILATFTLIEDANAILDTGWELSLFSDYETKYGLLLAIVAAMVAKQYFERRKNAIDVVKDGA